MKDQWGRINNRCQAIKEFNITQMAYILYLIRNNPGDYPDEIDDWLEWLECDSGESVLTF